MNLGFFPAEISYGDTIFNACGRFIPKAAQQIMGNDYYNPYAVNAVKYYIKNFRESEAIPEAARSLSSRVVFDEIPTEDLELLSKHFKKMNLTFNREAKFISYDQINAMGLSKLDTYVVCKNLQPPFDIYNFGRFIDGSDKYKLKKKGSAVTTITTKRCPYSETGEDLLSEDVKVEKSKDDEEMYDVRIKNDYIGILNRFAVMISLKPPSFHSGCYCIVNGSGQKFYVHAFEITNDLKIDRKIENRVGVLNNVTTVFAVGYTKKELEEYLQKCAKYIYTKGDGRACVLVRPQHEFEEGVTWVKDDPAVLDNIEESVDFNFDDLSDGNTDADNPFAF